MKVDFSKFPETPKGQYWRTDYVGLRSEQPGYTPFRDPYRNWPDKGNFIRIRVSLMKERFIFEDDVVDSVLVDMGRVETIEAEYPKFDWDSDEVPRIPHHDEYMPKYKHIPYPEEQWEATLIAGAEGLLQSIADKRMRGLERLAEQQAEAKRLAQLRDDWSLTSTDSRGKLES